MRPRLLIDVSQFACYPIPTGIQRTLLSIAQFWPSDDIKAEMGFSVREDLPYSAVPLDAFREAILHIFDLEKKTAIEMPSLSQQLVEFLSKYETANFEPQEIANLYDGYLFPDPTFDDRILDNVNLCLDRIGQRCFAISYDCLPQTHPQLFPNASHMGWTDRYFLTLRKFDNIAFISNRTRRVFENRLRRSPVPNAINIPLGADSFGRGTSSKPLNDNFIVVGTTEPRKRHTMILNTFERLWSQNRHYALRFFGIEGWNPLAVIERFRKCAKEQELFDWQEEVTDTQLRQAISSATGAIFVSEIEGYGLPPLEALSLGCPIIVTSDMPSLEGLPEYGQIRLDSPSEETLAAAVEKLVEPAENARLREEINQLELPGWQEVVNDLAAWIGQTISEARAADHRQ